MARVAADVARALGRTDDEARYERLFAAIRADFGARFLGPDGVYREKEGEPLVQTAQVLRSPSAWCRTNGARRWRPGWPTTS